MSSTPQSFDRVLSSMCTKPYPAAKEAATRFLATNPGDPETFPTIAELERQAIDHLGTIADLSDPAGYITTGGTEANIQAIRIAREQHAVSHPNIVVPESAHFSFRKAADLLGVEMRTIRTDAQQRADTAALEAAIDAHTIAVVAVAGSTEYGRVDPIPQIAEIATEHDVLCHVDAAWGGFVLPFSDHDWNFSDALIDTLTIDPHKMGRAPIPAGGLLTRSEELLASLRIETPYLESESQATLPGTRSGGGVAGTLVALQDLWPDGYRAMAHRQYQTAKWITTEFRDRGIPVVAPDLPLVAADIPDSQFTSLRDRGWRISRTRAGETRIVCMPHVTREMLQSFLTDLDRCRTESPVDQM